MAYLLLTLAAIFWGGNYVVGHMLVQEIDPYILSLIRWGGTTILMLSFYWRSFLQDLPVLADNLGINIVFSFLGQVSFPLTLYIGLQYTSSLNAAIYISCTPCMVLMINYFIFHENISWRNIVGVLASTTGVVYLAFSGGEDAKDMQAFGWGDVLTIISALSWAFYCALLRLKNKQVNSTSFVAFSSLIGTIILVPIVLVRIALVDPSEMIIFSFSPLLTIGVFYLILFPSWLSYVFWNKGVALIGTTRSEIYTHLIPVSGGLMGILFLGDRLEAHHIITLVLIIFGVVCCSTRK